MWLLKMLVGDKARILLSKWKSQRIQFSAQTMWFIQAPPFQVRWGNIKLFLWEYIVCTQKTIWIHVSCQSLIGIFSKGKLFFSPRKPPKRRPQHHIQLSPWLLPQISETTPTSLLTGMPGCQETQTCTDGQWSFSLNWMTGIVPFSSEFSSTEMF